MSLLDQLFQYSSVRNSLAVFSFTQQSIQLEDQLQSNLYSQISSFHQSPIKKQQPKKQSEISFNSIWSNDFLLERNKNKQFADHLDKFRKMDSVIRILSNKIRKINYEFFVKIQNQVKNRRKIEQFQGFSSTNQQKNTTNVSNKISNQNKINESIYRMINCIDNNYKQVKNAFFIKVLSNYKLYILMNKFVLQLSHTMLKHNNSLIYEGLNNLKQNNSQKQSVKISIHNPIILSYKVKKIIIKTSIEEHSFPNQHFDEQSKCSILPLIYPQRQDIQNNDYYDNIHLFLPNQQEINQLLKSQIQSASASICVSVLTMDNKNITPKNSLINLLSQEGINNDSNAHCEIKKNQDQTFCSGTIDQPYFGGQDKQYSTSKTHNQLSRSTKVEKNCQQQNKKQYQQQLYFTSKFSNKRLSFQEKDDNRPYLYQCEDTFSKKYEDIYQKRKLSVNDTNLSYQPLNGKKMIIPRYKSPTIDQQLAKFNKTQRQLRNYQHHKQTFDQRRVSTLKQIQKSKEIIKQIVKDLNQSKTQKQKIVIPKNKNQSFYQYSKDKNLSLLSSKRNSFSNNKSNQKKKYSSPQVAKKLSISKTSISKKQKLTQFEINQNCNNQYQQKNITPARNIEIFHMYLTAKNKLSQSRVASLQNRQVLYKLCQKNIIKQQLPKNNCTAQKNLLTISKFPINKQKRIDLKIDLSKTGSRGNNVTEKQKKKCADVQVIKAKITLK